MGSSFWNEPKGRKTIDIMREQYGERFTILAHAMGEGNGDGSRTFYAAVKENETGEVTAVADLVWRRSKDYYNFGHKDIHEGMGPACAECPDRILDMLSPTNVEYAIEWRERCRRHNEAARKVKALRPGAILRLPNPLTFSNGEKCDTFRNVDGKTWDALGTVTFSDDVVSAPYAMFRCRLSISPQMIAEYVAA